MKLTLISIAVGLGGYAFAVPLNGTTCQGRYVYWENISHMGGAGPGPNGLMSHTELKIRGKVVEHIEHKANAPTPTPVYSVTFDEKTKKVLQSSGGTTSGWQTYSILVDVSKKSGNPLHLRERVTCRRSWAMLP